MPDGPTTIKVSGRIIRFLNGKAWPEESTDETLRRLLKISGNGNTRPAPISDRCIKVSRIVMNHVVKAAKKKESRNETLERLLGMRKVS